MAENVGQIYYDVTLETGEMVRKSRQASRELDNLGGGMNRVAAAAAALASSLALGAVMQRAIAASRAYEKALADLSAITGATGDGLRRLSEEAKTLSRESTASAGDVVTAMKLIAGAKSELLETGGALAAVTKEAIALSEAAGIALPQAANAVVLALNQFGEGADQAARFVNVLAAGAKEGASEIADTALALKNAGVSAASAKVSFEETNAALQTLAAAGVKGAEAGTALRNIILILETSADTKLKPSINGLAGALENLAAKGLDATAMAELFGRENIAAGQQLVNNTAQLQRFTDALTGTSTAYEQAATNNATFDASVRKMNNAIDLAAQKLGDELMPIAKAAADSITALALQFVEGSTAMKVAGQVLQAGLVLLAVSITGKVALALTTFTLLLIRAVPVIGAATIASKGFAAALALMGGPIGIAVTALALLALNWDKIAGSADRAARISEESARRIDAALAKGGDAARSDLGAQLERAQAELARLDKQIADGSVRSIYGDRGPVAGERQLERLRAQRAAALRAVVDTRAALDGLNGLNYGNEGRRTPTGAPAVAPAPAPAPAAGGPMGDPEAVKRSGDEIARAYAASLQAQQRIQEEADDLAARFFIDQQARLDREAQEAAQREAQRQQTRRAAEDILAASDPLKQVELQLQRESELLTLYAQQDLANAQLYADAKVALTEQTAARVAAIRQREVDDERARGQMLVQIVGDSAGQLYGLLESAGKERTALGKALFLTQKALAVAEILLNTEVAAAKAIALNPIVGPALAVGIRAMGYASAGMVAGLAVAQVAGGRQYGGPVEAGSLYRINEGGRPEMFTAANGNQYMLPTKSGQVTAANKVPQGGPTFNYSPTINVNGDVSAQTIQAMRAEIAADRTRWMRQMSLRGSA